MNLKDDFLLLNADAVFDIDFNRFVAYHKEKGRLVVYMVKEHKLISGNSYNFDDNIVAGSPNKAKNFKLVRRFISCILNFIYGDMVILKHYHSCKKEFIPKKYDVILSIGQPFYTHMLSAFSKVKSGCIKIADCGDPFYVKGMAPHIKLVQKRVLNKLDYVAIPTEKAVPYYKEYIPIKKIKVIPQGVDFNDFEIAEYKRNDVPRFCYAGIFYKDIRDPRGFIEELARIKNDYKFIIYTDISSAFFKNEIMPIIDKCKGKIEINNIIPRRKCIYEMSKMEFLVNFENKSSTQSPSKLIDYGIANRPVLSFSEGTFDRQTFLEFLNGDYSKRLKFDISKYDINTVTEQFESLF